MGDRHNAGQVGTTLVKCGPGDVVFGAVALAVSLVVALFATETKGQVLEEISP